MAFPPPKSHVKTMFHHTTTNNQTSSYPLHTNYTAHDEVEFDFWGQYDDNNSSHGDGREMSKFEADIPLWEKHPSKNVRFESSFPLVPHTQQFSNMSTNWRRHTIAEGQRQLMEMVRGMPESTYELSLKDLVDKHQVQEVEEMAIKETSIALALNSEAQINNQKIVEMRNISRSGPISRSGSMGKETFMIKMYVPASLSWKAKANTGLGARISRTPLYISEKHDVDKDWWIKRIFLAGASSRSNSSRSTSSSSSSVDGLENTSFFHGCYPFFCNRKSKGKKIRGNIC